MREKERGGGKEGGREGRRNRKKSRGRQWREEDDYFGQGRRLAEERGQERVVTGITNVKV